MALRGFAHSNASASASDAGTTGAHGASDPASANPDGTDQHAGAHMLSVYPYGPGDSYEYTGAHGHAGTDQHAGAHMLSVYPYGPGDSYEYTGAHGHAGADPDGTGTHGHALLRGHPDSALEGGGVEEKG